MSLANHRDLGGLVAENGRLTRSGRLFRSAAPEPSNDPGDSTYALVVDLRCTSEWKAPEHPFATYARIMSMPLLNEADHRHAIKNFNRIDVPAWYAYVVQQYAHQLIRTATTCMTTDGPVLVHCAAGKDRTGLLVALLLRLAGVSAQLVETDYLRSNDPGRGAPRAERGPIPDPARSESIRAAMAVWDQHGGVAAWFRRHGGRDEDVATWTSSFLVSE